ncbi:MAG: GTPase Era [Bacteroidales bacterium]|nr:GTPase Era [Bacteroidales bacterium]
MSSNHPPHRSGFVNIIGNPNVGKSTLMNALVGERLSIVTSKAQTTRHRIMGIVNGDNYQIVYSDTPGILRPSYKLQESMMNFVETAIGDADIILYITDVVEKSDKNREYVQKLNMVDCPVIVVINKIDISTQEEVLKLAEYWKGEIPKADVFIASAIEKFNLDAIFNRIVELLPIQPAWYDKDTFTDKNLRFFASEIIREKILLNYSKEIPYCTEVVIEEFKEHPDRYDIQAVINVMRDSQKGIIIGSKGASLKKVGIEARKDMEEFFEKKVFLQTFVKVNPNWREDKRKLKSFGYIL